MSKRKPAGKVPKKSAEPIDALNPSPKGDEGIDALPDKPSPAQVAIEIRRGVIDDLDALGDALSDWRDTLRELIESNHDAEVIESLGTLRRAITKARRMTLQARSVIGTK